MFNESDDLRLWSAGVSLSENRRWFSSQKDSMTTSEINSTQPNPGYESPVSVK